MLQCNSDTVIRLIIVPVLVGFLFYVVAAIIVSVIYTTPCCFCSSRLIVRADIYVALDRLVATYELDELYSRRQTLHDIIDGLNKQFSQAFPQTFFKLVVTAFSGKPILITDLRRKKQQYDRPSIITVNGTIYFVANYTKNDILNALKNCSETITFVTVDGQPSTKLATFSTLYSTCTDTYLDSRSQNVVKELRSIDVIDPSITTYGSTLSTSTDTLPTTLATDTTITKQTEKTTITPYTSSTSSNATPILTPLMTTTPYTSSTSSNVTSTTETGWVWMWMWVLEYLK
ncbi:unnamed protein product [Adineta steineri]|uniref:Uncharacterized protein n=1 Tax=Adineta steineri TaxID=433720 RepID=A0A819N4L4_9BILA|nr:unnamed protein product [Adineta steineri]CAF1021147.1 unnamed protein product [Adineta steineri]CAF3990633.1 unnamed protein product [Adineta steineri]CAF4093514.1 unnamed protein product [Adineta steineri]